MSSSRTAYGVQFHGFDWLPVSIRLAQKSREYPVPLDQVLSFSLYSPKNCRVAFLLGIIVLRKCPSADSTKGTKYA
jgi:hypothetical protein